MQSPTYQNESQIFLQQEIERKIVRDSLLSFLFFLLRAAKVRFSCEEGPGQSALQSAYHDPQLDVTELKQNRTT